MKVLKVRIIIPKSVGSQDLCLRTTVLEIYGSWVITLIRKSFLVTYNFYILYKANMI